MDSDLLAQILAGQSGGLRPDVLSATGAGVSRTDLSALLNPTLMAQTGVLDPYRLAQGVDPFWERAALEVAQRYEAERNRILARVVPPPELDLNDVLPKYFDPQYADIADPIAGLFGLIDQGYSANQVKLALDNAAESFPRLTEYETQLREDFERYEKERERVNKARRDFELDQRKAEAELGALQRPDMPDYEATRRRFYEEQGVPGLASLPDPRRQYQFTEEDILSLIGKDPEEERLALWEQTALRRMANPTDRERAQFDAVSMVAPNPFELEAQQRAARTVDGRGAAPGQFAASRLDMISALTGEDVSSMEKAIRQAATTRERVAADLQKQLLAQGRTPFEDAMRSLLQYSVQESAPRPRAAAPRPLSPRITV